MNLENIKDIFDFDNFDYFYHETSVDRAKSIMQQGLLVDGTNILGTNNILFTTTCRISEDMVPTSQAFIDYVESEFGPSNIRDVSAMVILAADKSWEEEIVEPFGQYVDDHYYQGIIRPQHVVGYIDMQELAFYSNENYEYADDVTDAVSFGRR